MSRRIPNPAAERAAQNAQTIKGLLKLEGNKMCADCKRNKHPRWASWNLGVFICIRCSGIHRGMGTHISRVKSVDLDAWTDEQLQSILKWGNSRANKYWEAKLAVDHVPSESKIENFIRTKYESKRWVLDGPIPDPSTLEADGDDDVPLSLVKKKQSIERSSSQKTSQNHFQTVGLSESVKSMPQSDLLENEISSPFGESSATSAKIILPAKSNTVPPKQIKPADSLLGLDFFGTTCVSPIQSISSSPMTSVNSRPDLKQSILSLYATAPRPNQLQQQKMSKSTQDIFGSMSQSPVISTGQNTSLENGISDAFKSLNFSSQKTSSTVLNQTCSSAFSDLGNLSSCRSSISQTPIKANGGNFFTSISAAKPEQQPTPPSCGLSISNDFGTFDSAPEPSPTAAKNNISSLDIFDFTKSTPTPQVQDQKPNLPPAMQQVTTVFNISKPDLQKSKNVTSVLTNNLFSSTDNWGSSNAWASPTNSVVQNQMTAHQTSFDDSGWGNNATGSGVADGAKHVASGENSTNPIVSNDEEFGDWGSAASATTIIPMKTAGLTSTSAVSHKSAAGLAGNDDLFSNVWG